MKRKIKAVNPYDLYIGMRVKLPLEGWFFGVNKNVWVKGRIVKLGDIREGGKFHSIITHCYSKKYGAIGRIMLLNERCDEIYKTR